MRRTLHLRSTLVALIGVSALLRPAPASAEPSGVPSAANSVVAANLVTCPAGHLSFTVVVKDAAGSPVQNSNVVVDFCAAVPPIDVCLTPGCTFTGTTNATGTVVLNIPAGGTAASTVVAVRADAVLLAQRAVASTDQNGDLLVTAADITAINALLGTIDKRGDLDGDGFVTSADVSIVQAHMTHACGGPVDARQHSWGVLKIRYR